MVVHRSPLPDVVIPTHMTLSEFVFENVEAKASRISFIDGITQKSTTFGELWQRIRRTAAGLQQLGLQKGEVVGVWSPNHVDYVVAFHATILAGGTITTLNPIYTPHEVAFQLDNSEAHYLVTLPSFVPKVAEAQQTYKGLREVFLLGDEPVNGFRLLQSLEINAEPTKVPIVPSVDVCALPYSSGTTGLPKGVMLTHTNIIANISQCTSGGNHIGLRSSDALLAVLPFYHIYGMVVMMNNSIRVGAKCISMPSFDPEPYLKNLKLHKVTIAYVAPPLVQFLAKAPLVDQYLPFPDLKELFCGAAPLGVALSQAAQDRLGMHVAVRQGYGMTELSPVSHADWAKGPTLGSIGVLVPNMECKIVNPDTGKLQPVGTEKERGEIWVRGLNVMKGYHRNEKATRETIDADGYLHTGDIGFVDDKGIYYIVDRLKELIKAKGFQVAPAELEALFVKHPQVADAAVIGAPADKYGGREADGEVPKAFIILQPGATITKSELSAWLAPQVVSYKNVSPHAIDFVESLPKSASGKILRKDLREIEKTLPPKSKL
uniref:4-coumarate--CoA ligase n=1 Tax=Noctiluca scintillans TaxID=2966 RepID=A0A7S0ZXV9_NOCSC|mmetsp:Transcript_23226/g.61009  ORF Transcript_23226/g.61009 Transcript_23226/m.61009 type:complete len:547 (+) Transcript_23226:44-1684(+)|eukprot:CAMPEP_0194501928 /NCGR_PEP_ID=MMETSP0253-20130528/23669_1 /TAXON_ID=2966 /ORGANISM="Noctiluca scintillans" /LENGTH=546 /DNA_ID=CAMNT_0039343987 /DNA_START=42 /DNA_END=1682 /DNA_ORIENTATION=+